MELHASADAANRLASQRVAGEVRAELARQKRTANELATVLGISAHTAGRRLSGDVPFNVIELAALCQWLNVDLADLIGRVKRDTTAVAS